MSDDYPNKIRWRRPACDVFESESAVEIFADVPGARRQDLAISVEGDELLVETHLPDDDASLNVPRYRRKFRVSSAVDRQAIRAQLRDGVLQLTLPLREQGGPRTIDIEE